MDLYCCHGNGCDVTINLRVLPDKSGFKIFMVCPHDQKNVFAIFPRFKRIIAIKKPCFLATLNVTTVVQFAISATLRNARSVTTVHDGY